MTYYNDEQTGVRIRRLVSGVGRNEVIYQTHPQWALGMEYLVFNSDRGEGKLPYALHLKSGEVRCLAEIGALDWTLAPRKGRLFVLQGKTLVISSISQHFTPHVHFHSITLNGLEKLHPSSLSPDAQGEKLYCLVELEAGKQWAVVTIDLREQQWRVLTKPEFRVGHVQANPEIPGLVMFCHETGGDSPQRIWMVNDDGERNGKAPIRPFCRETYDEWITHEVWWQGDRVLFTIWPYDESHLQQPHGIVSADLETEKRTVHYQYPAWHTHGSPDGKWIVGDDFDRNLWLIKRETGERKLLTQGHWNGKIETHPHASFTPDSQAVVFNSSRDGTEDIFLAEIPAWEKLFITA